MAKNPTQELKTIKKGLRKKLIDAVGTVIRKHGYTGLTVGNISACADVNRRLINLYFGSLDNLVETYVRGKDYWAAPAANASELFEKKKDEDTRMILESLLQSQLDYFSKEEEMQKIVLWQLSQRSKIMFEVAEEREKLGAEFFAMSDKFFDKTDVDLRAISGLLVGGIYYMVLHAKSNDSLFCQIDVNTQEGINRIKKAVSEILYDVYKRAEKQKIKIAKK